MELRKTLKETYDFVWVLIFIVIILIAFAWVFVKEDVIFKYQVEIRDYNYKADNWLKNKRIWYLNNGKRYKFMNRSSATMFKIIWG